MKNKTLLKLLIIPLALTALSQTVNAKKTDLIAVSADIEWVGKA